MHYLELFHWTFLAISLGVAVLTHLTKRISKLLPKDKAISLLVDGRVVPAVLGFLIGLAPGIPLPEMVTYGTPSALYFMTAGIVSAWVYSLIEKIFKDTLPEKIKNWAENLFKKNK